MIWVTIAGLSIVAGLMGAWTGAGGSKLWRRFVIPLMCTVFAYVIYQNLWCIMMMTMAFVYSLGYGIPTPPTDQGSPLGRFWYNIFNGNVTLATAFTRATIGVFLGLSVIAIPAITGHWWPPYGIIFLLLVLNQVFWTVFMHNLGSFPFLGRMLLREEFYIYLCDTALITTLAVIS